MDMLLMIQSIPEKMCSTKKECAMFMFMYLASYAPGELPFNFQIPTLVTGDLLNENELSLTANKKFFTSL